jgi:hypothetical protein
MQMSFRDIGLILRDADKQKEADQEQTRKEFVSSQAYKLLSEKMRLSQVAMELNIRSADAIVFQREYWEMEGLHELNLVYNEIKFEIWPLINLWRSVEAAGKSIQHIVTLIKVANNDLPTLENKYVTLKDEVNSLEQQKRNLSNAVTTKSNELEYYRVQCQREKASFNYLQQRTKKAEALATHFETNSQGYINIKRMVEEKVYSTLTNRKVLLGLAIYCLIESIKRDPYKYSPLISENMPSSESRYDDYNDRSYSYGRPSYFDAKLMLVEESEKMYNLLAKDLVDEILWDYPDSVSSPALPMLPASDERGGSAKHPVNHLGADSAQQYQG